MPAGESSDEAPKDNEDSCDSFDFVQKQVEKEKKAEKKALKKDRKKAEISEKQDEDKKAMYFDAYDDLLFSEKEVAEKSP